MSESYESDEGELEYFLGILRRRSAHLRVTGSVAVLALLAHVLICAVTPVVAFSFRDYDDNVIGAWVALPIASGAVSLLAVVYFDVVRRRLDVLFEEISDEIQWFVRRSAQNNADTGAQRPTINMRLAVREASRVQDLPIVPGRFGPAAYGLVNMIAMFVAVVIVLQRT